MPGARLLMTGSFGNAIDREGGADDVGVDGIEHIADGVRVAIGSDDDCGTKDDGHHHNQPAPDRAGDVPHGGTAKPAR